MRSPVAEGAGNADIRYEISDISECIPFGDDFEISLCGIEGFGPGSVFAGGTEISYEISL